MELVIDTCILEDTSRGVPEAQEFIYFLYQKILNCEHVICIDHERKILSEYEQKISENSFGGLLFQKAQDLGKIKIIIANRSHPVCQKVKEISPVLDEHDLTFLAVTIRTNDKKFFTNDTGFYEPIGERNIERDFEGKPIPIEPIRNAGLLLLDIKSWEKGF